MSRVYYSAIDRGLGTIVTKKTKFANLALATEFAEYVAKHGYIAVVWRGRKCFRLTGC